MSHPSDVTDWWQTAIIDMEPGRIALRGHPIETLIGNMRFSDMIWLMTQGTLPSPGQSRLLEAALVAAVDHGPQAPSIATARMAMTCGVGINNAIASGINVLGDVHGGAGEQALKLYLRIAADGGTEPLEARVERGLAALEAEGIQYVPGFGHRFHRPSDPRAAPLMRILREVATLDDRVDGQFAEIAEAIQASIAVKKGKPIAMNIDGATAAIFGALGIDPVLARGLFCLSRAVGLTAHAYEQSIQGGRNKGPTPPHYRWRYTGPASGTG